MAIIGMLAGCADVGSVYISQRNPPEFMQALAAGTLTEQALGEYKAAGAVAAVVYEQSTVMVEGLPVRSSTWMISCHQDESIKTFVIFVGGKFYSSTEIRVR